MTVYTTALVACPQDQSVAILAANVIDALAESFETFRDKQQVDALHDVHQALLSWEELVSGLDPTEGIDLNATVTTEDTQWYIDFASPQWVLDLRMSIFHGKLIFEAAQTTGE